MYTPTDYNLGTRRRAKRAEVLGANMADNSNHAPNHIPEPLAFPHQPLLIEHTVEGEIVLQRPRDGYINATAMCKAAGKRLNDYLRLGTTKAFLEALALDAGIPASNLVQMIRGRGDRVQQGTWVHPDVAINLGQWLSPAFAVQVSRWVRDWWTNKDGPHMPLHVRRYMVNRNKIPHDQFSMLNEIYLNLVAPLEDCGITLPDMMTPDISTGRMFSDFLRKKGIDPDTFDTYEHVFLDGKRPTVYPRLYPIEYLPDFRRYFNEVWLPQRAERYFAKRCPDVLPFLDRIKPLPKTNGSRQELEG